MPLNKAQKEAVEYLDGPLLVLAGPGTGKTQLLSSKVAYILQNTDTSPENILCITFTEAGARNMRDRLLSIIGPEANKVSIHTYHAFGADLLAQYKNYAASFSRNLDDAIDDVIQHKIIQQIIDDLSPLDIMKSSRVRDIIDTISSAKSARLTPSDLRAIAKQNIADSENISKEAALILENLVPRMKYDLAISEIYQPLMELFIEYSSPDPIIKNIERIGNSLLISLKDAIDASTAKEKPSISPLTSWKNANFIIDDSGKYHLSDAIANKKLIGFADIYEKYQQKLADNNLYDFDDMIEEAINTLKTDDGFRLTLTERYQFILLDEFQDTNPSQFEIIKLLTDYESPVVMAVGDDDQAIFEFQGANASNLLDFQNYYNAKVITLTENYRSSADILNASHKIAGLIPDSFAKKHSINKLLHPNTSPKSPEIARHEFISSDAEYYWIADQIHNLIQSGEKQKDIAIITPKHKYIQPLLPYLKAHPDINISYEKRENILEDTKIHQLIILSRYIFELFSGKNPKHRILEILSFPFWGISPIEALSASELPLEQTQNPKIQQVYTFLSGLVAEVETAPLELFLDYLIGVQPYNNYTSPFLEYYTEKTDYQTFELYDNLSVLREKIKSHTKNQKPTLTDFITMLDDYESAGAGIISTSPYQDSENSVQLLSAHKSKGLEFKHVFIIATDNMAWGKAKGNSNLLVLPKNLIQIRHTGNSDSELIRLFFVAITRAKEKLIITNSIKNYAGKSPARLDYLNETPDNENILSPLIPSGKVITHYGDLEEAKRLTDIHKSWVASYFKPTPELLPILKKRLEHYKLTASDLTTFIDVAYAGPLEFYKRKVLRMPSEPATPEINYGNLVHAAFEKATKEHLDNAAAIDFYKTSALALPISQHDINQLIEKGAHSLEIALNEFKDILHAPGAGAEVDFYHEHLTVNGIEVTGKIDHINIDEENKTIEIYDFKTGKYHGTKWDSHATLFKYKLQLGFYKLLIENSPTYQKYKVNRAHILFVTPDEDGKVYDAPYEYNPEDEKLLSELITATFKHIKALDFTSGPLAVEPDSTKGLKDIKEFIATILDN